MKILMFAPVLRKGSFNKKLIRIAHEIVSGFPEVKVKLREFNEFPMPVYDGDLESEQGLPAGVKDLAAAINEADAIIISSPEYNGSIPGPFKNAIDWVSRIAPVPWEGKQILLIGASQGYFAAVKGHFHSRVPLQVLKSHVYPDYFGLAFAHKAFDENDQLKDPKDKERLAKLLVNFVHYAAKTESPFDKLTDFLEAQMKQH
ncbi:NADPH-dependent FMN reductase [Bdellovibrio sp. NC01]|uniref:NADPH-dependent FMN reductase n=1 Tax=Bdellovibrio sp. NC01 TaxID=2220073 RepID=UPI001158F204|nr:NAD(P)H-dependent oxidoreductase [Bdellovibrio sp. NC01]QDK37594.1 alpha-glucosidase [Bdellovibrio sp. NC01]